jgi:hypothetical protein
VTSRPNGPSHVHVLLPDAVRGEGRPGPWPGRLAKTVEVALEPGRRSRLFEVSADANRYELCSSQFGVRALHIGAKGIPGLKVQSEVLAGDGGNPPNPNGRG